MKKFLLVLMLLVVPGAAWAQLGSVPFPAISGTVISSSQYNTNLSTAFDRALNRQGGTMTGTFTALNIVPGVTATYDIGTSSVKFRDFFLSRNALIGGTLGVTGQITGNVTGAVTGNADTATLAASATKLATARAIYGNNFDGTAALAQIIASTFGGTGNGFAKFSGPTTSEKTFTLPDATATILTSNAAVTAAQGGTGIASYAVGDIIYASAGTTLAKLADVAAGSFLRSGGVTTAPAWSTLTIPNTIVANRVLYTTSANTIGSNSAWTFDGTSWLLTATVGITGTTSINGAVSGQVFIPTTTSNPGDGMALQGTHGLAFYANSALAASIYSSGGVFIGSSASDPGAGNLEVGGEIRGHTLVPNSAATPTDGINLVTAHSLGIFTNSVQAMKVFASGGVGIGASPSDPGTGGFTASPMIAGTLSIISSPAIFNTTSAFPASGAGDVFVCHATSVLLAFHEGATCAASARRFKTNEMPLDHGLDYAMALKPVAFDWKQSHAGRYDGKSDIGLIADDVEQVDTRLAIYQDGDVYSINDRGILAVAIKSVQELKLQNDRLEARIAQLEAAH